MTREVDVAIIGAGSAGLYAMSQIKRFTDNFVLIDGGELGTTCARVGCMPSKVMIQIADDFHRQSIFKREGIEGGEHLRVNQQDAMEHIQDLRDTFVDMTLGHSIDIMPEQQLIESYVHFIDEHTLETDDGDIIKAKKIIIATGSSPTIPEAWKNFGKNILSTEDIFELEELPDSLAVIGLGVIGLELGQALNRLGVKVTGIDQQHTLGGIQDDDINQMVIQVIGKEMPLWLGQAADIQALDNGKFQVSAGDKQVEVDKVLVSMGRHANIKRLNLARAGVKLQANGIPEFNPHTMQLGDSSIYIAGDCNGQKAILHEAGFEGRVAGYNAMQEKAIPFRHKTAMAITFSDPNIVMLGQQLTELDADTIVTGEVKLAPVGRALIMGKNRGLIHIYANKSDGKILGACMLSVKGENLAHLLCWAIEMNMTVYDLLRMPFYHPTIEEALQAALYNLKSKLALDEPHWPIEIQPLD